MATRILYAGSFDPPTMGHVDLIDRAARAFGEVVVGVGANISKKPLFTVEERVALLEEYAPSAMKVVAFDGLAVECARAQGCGLLLRGLRTASDFEAELAMALTNRRLAPDVDTVFLPPSERFGYLSSRLVKEVVLGGGRIDEFIPPRIAEEIRRRLTSDDSQD